MVSYAQVRQHFVVVQAHGQDSDGSSLDIDSPSLYSVRWQVHSQMGIDYLTNGLHQLVRSSVVDVLHYRELTDIFTQETSYDFWCMGFPFLVPKLDFKQSPV